MLASNRKRVLEIASLVAVAGIGTWALVRSLPSHASGPPPKSAASVELHEEPDARELAPSAPTKPAPQSAVAAVDAGATARAPTPKEFVADVARSSCEAAAACCGANGFSFTAARCERAIAREEQADLGSPEHEGQSFDPVAAAECLQRKRKLAEACGAVEPDEWDRITFACGRVFSKRASPGEACTWDGDCAKRADAESYCVLEPASPDKDHADRKGTCAEHPAPAVGQSCAWAAPGDVDYCERAGLRCDEASGACQALGGTGDACTTPQDCGRAFVCLEGTCRPRADVGAPCTGPSSCAEGLVCGGEGRCVKAKAGGAPCEMSFECASGVCSQGHCLTNAFGTRRRCGGEAPKSP